MAHIQQTSKDDVRLFVEPPDCSDDLVDGPDRIESAVNPPLTRQRSPPKRLKADIRVPQSNMPSTLKIAAHSTAHPTAHG